MPFDGVPGAGGIRAVLDELGMELGQLLEVVPVPAIRHTILCEAFEITLGADPVQLVAVLVERGREETLLQRANVNERLEELGCFVRGAKDLGCYQKHLMLQLWRCLDHHEVACRGLLVILEDLF